MPVCRAAHHMVSIEGLCALACQLRQASPMSAAGAKVKLGEEERSPETVLHLYVLLSQHREALQLGALANIPRPAQRVWFDDGERPEQRAHDA